MRPRRDRPPKPAVTPQRIAELDRERRRSATIRTVTRIAIVWALLTGIYFVAPFDGVRGGDGVARLGISLAVFVAAAAWELSQTAKAELPEFRAITALATLTPLFIVLFAGVYLSISISKPDSFNIHLDHVKALYFVITTLSTVGFGDIIAKTNLTRIIVSVQMLLDLILIGSIVRILAQAAKRGLERDGAASGDTATDSAVEPPS